MNRRRKVFNYEINLRRKVMLEGSLRRINKLVAKDGA
jgi:hypothetical protein